MPRDYAILALDWGSGEPAARLLPIGAPAPSELSNLRGMTLEYRVEPYALRCCLGHYDYSDKTARHVDCAQRLPASGPRKCRECSQMDEVFATNMHHAHTRGLAGVAPQFRDHLSKPHLLYLAAFRDGTIKVGTSAAYRCSERLAEQGAWQAAIVAATTDGLAVRDIEMEVGEVLRLPQTVSASRKLRSHAAPRGDEQIEAGLFETATQARNIIGRSRDQRVTRRDDSWRFPMAARAVWGVLTQYPTDIASGSHRFEVVDVCGKAAAVRPSRDLDLMVVNLGALIGVPLSTTDVVPDEIQIQGALF